MRFGKPKPSPSTKVIIQSGVMKDDSRNRDVAWIASYKDDPNSLPVALLSHGGDGSTNGYKSSLEYVREAIAKEGYLAISVQHRKSKNETQHLTDRPKDCSFILSKLLSGELKIQADFLNKDFVHIGHSAGSYTGIALAGGKFKHGTFPDPRFKAFVSLSPQGPGELGCQEDTWDNIDSTVYFFSGTKEDNKNGKGWRKIPFNNSPKEDVKFWSLVNGMNHEDLGRGGSPEQSKYVTDNIIAYLKWFFYGSVSISTIGTLSFVKGTEISNSSTQ